MFFSHLLPLIHHKPNPQSWRPLDYFRVEICIHTKSTAWAGFLGAVARSRHEAFPMFPITLCLCPWLQFTHHLFSWAFAYSGLPVQVLPRDAPERKSKSHPAFENQCHLHLPLKCKIQILNNAPTLGLPLNLLVELRSSTGEVLSSLKGSFLCTAGTAASLSKLEPEQGKQGADLPNSQFTAHLLMEENLNFSSLKQHNNKC